MDLYSKGEEEETIAQLNTYKAKKIKHLYDTKRKSFEVIGKGNCYCEEIMKDLSLNLTSKTMEA
jgi:hypothetical protein